MQNATEPARGQGCSPNETIRVRNQRNGMVKRRRKQQQIEQEFGEPFWDVVRGFAEQGCGKYLTAQALGWATTSFLKMLKAEDPGIRWPTMKEQVAARPLYRPPDIGARISAGIQRARSRAWTG